MAQRAAGGVARREERGRHADAVRPHNVTSEMGLALLDVADVIRPHPEVVAFLAQSRTKTSSTSCPSSRAAAKRETPSGLPRQVRHALRRRDRHHEAALERAPEHARARDPRQRRELRAGRRRAALRARPAGGRAKEQELLERLRALPDGEQKAEEAKRKIDRVRTFIGYREYPKYGMVSRYFVYKQALLEEAARLVQAGVLRDGRTSSTSRSRSSTTSCARHQVDDELIARARTRSGRTRR